MEHLPTPDVTTSTLYSDIRNILTSARQRAYAAVNFAMVESYWLIGQRIVEHEQQGAERVAYGKHILKKLAPKLTEEFGKYSQKSIVFVTFRCNIRQNRRIF